METASAPRRIQREAAPGSAKIRRLRRYRRSQQSLLLLLLLSSTWPGTRSIARGYMWHLLIILIVINAVAEKLVHASTSSMSAFCVMCYAIIFAIAYLSYFFIETPARRYIDNLGSRRARATPSASRYSATNGLTIEQAERNSTRLRNNL